MLTLLAGLMAGLVHVLSGPDHLAAVAPIAADRPTRAAWSGLMWGTGHTTGVLAVGALALALRGLLPVLALSSWSERLVGVALIAIGLWGLRQALLRHWHVHTHTHAGVPHTHIHYHEPALQHDRPGAHAHTHMAVAMGALHGLAGSAHVLGILPALALPTLAGSLAYLLAFGTGAIVAMMVYGWLIGTLLLHSARSGLNSLRWVLTGSSMAALAIGAVWLVR
jgi:hypothetical protein